MCGFAVEWLRTRYQSQWRLFKDRPDLKTRGRYVVCKPGTPHYRDWHNLGSRVWTSDEREEEPELGEVTNAKHIYDYGNPEDFLPPAGLIGSAVCMAEGEPWPLPVIDRTFRGGFDSRCYLIPTPGDETGLRAFDVRDCHDQKRGIQVINQLYTGTANNAITFAQEFLPIGTYYGWNNTSDTVPGCVIYVNGSLTVIWIAGTTTPQQWALQGLTGLAGLQNYGRYSTLAFWQTSSNALFNRLQTTTSDPNGTIVICGHSYGGALAIIMAARMRLWQPDRDIQLMTYGAPKPGDERLCRICQLMLAYHFQNDDDPICYLPPSAADLGEYATNVPTIILNRWLGWHRPIGLIGLTINGVRYDSPLPQGASNLLNRVMLEFLDGWEPEAFNAHTPYEYIRRINCPSQPTPSPDPAVLPALWLQSRSLGVFNTAMGEPITSWADSSVYNNPAVGADGETMGDANEAWVGFVNGTFLDSARLTLTRPLTPAGDWTMLVVMAWTGLPGLGFRLFPTLNTGNLWPCITSTGIGFVRGLVTQTVIAGDTRGLLHLFGWRKDGAGYKVYYDRNFLGSLSISSLFTFAADAVGQSVTGVLALPTCYRWEYVYLEGPVTDADVQDWQEYLCELYGIP